MKPVIIQHLIRNMRKNAKLPMPTINDAPPIKKDRAGQIVVILLLLVVIAVILL